MYYFNIMFVCIILVVYTVLLLVSVLLVYVFLKHGTKNTNFFITRFTFRIEYKNRGFFLLLLLLLLLAIR